MSSMIIGRLDLNEEKLRKDLETVTNFPVLKEEYSEFGVGTWKNDTLWNENGNFRDTQYRDYATPGMVTERGLLLPYIQEMIGANFHVNHLKMVRTRNLIDGLIVPHKDFVELNKPKNFYLRIFIPLEDNANSYHSDESGVFRMRKGEIWILDASIVHAAANFSNESRIFLCLDFQFDEKTHPSSIFLDQRAYNEKIKPAMAKREPVRDINKHLGRFYATINEKNFKEITVDLAKLHFQYEVSVSDCYNWLADIAQHNGKKELVDKALALKEYMIENRRLGQRFPLEQ